MTKLCKICDEEKDLSEFYTNGYSPSGKRKYKPECKLCHNRNKKAKKTDFINEILVELNLSLKCSKCGYNKNKAALAFHHLDENEKDFSFSGTKFFSKDKLREEIKKCVLLCSNCHMEEHYPHMNLV